MLPSPVDTLLTFGGYFVSILGRELTEDFYKVVP